MEYNNLSKIHFIKRAKLRKEIYNEVLNECSSYQEFSGGELNTYYICKTDAQFNNNFKKIVKDQLGIKYDWQEPNWNTIKNSFISREGIKKNFPKYYNLTKDADADADVFNWDDYKYLWSIKKVGGVHIIALSKRVNGTKYVSFTMVGSGHQWAYTQEVLTVLERNFN